MDSYKSNVYFWYWMMENVINIGCIEQTYKQRAVKNGFYITKEIIQ